MSGWGGRHLVFLRVHTSLVVSFLGLLGGDFQRCQSLVTFPKNMDLKHGACSSFFQGAPEFSLSPSTERRIGRRWKARDRDDGGRRRL